MKRSCTIIISHFESVNFLHTCIKQIRKYSNPQIDQHIIVADQSRDLYHNNIVGKYWGDEDVTVIKTQPLYSGFGIDYIMRHVEIKSEYICQLHVDAFPINKNWLHLPIKLLEEYNLFFVGQLHFHSKPTDTIYPVEKMFFSMSPTFNVARTETYMEMSLHGGFTRFHNRTLADPKMAWLNDDWGKWAAADYQARGSDDDVVAFCWEDNYREHNKLGLAITGAMGVHDGGSFGRVIEDIVFHFGSCRESIGVLELMGKEYSYWTERINNGFNEKLIDEMFATVIPVIKVNRQRFLWDGKSKELIHQSEELEKRIEELKNV